MLFPSTLSPGDTTNCTTIEDLENQCSECTACKLHKTRNTTVFGKGNINADLLLVGE